MEEPLHRRRLHRFDVAGHARFLTFSCYRRLPLLNHDGIRQLLIERLSNVLVEQQIRLLGWVLMPEHVHLMLFSAEVPDLGHFTHSLKRPVAEIVIRRWKEIRAPILEKICHGGSFRFWQTGGGYDRNVVEPNDVRSKIDYMHANPVRRGLVVLPTEYPWSSARWFAGFADAKIVCSELPF